MKSFIVIEETISTYKRNQYKDNIDKMKRVINEKWRSGMLAEP